MPRKAKQKPATDMTRNVDHAVLEKATKNRDQLNKHLAEIDSIYGDGFPYETTIVINEARFYLQQSADAMLEAGKRLILLKEHEPHGEFIQALEQIGIAPRAAQKMMQAAVKFSGSRKSIAATLNKSKLLELMATDDEELDHLAEGGTLAGHTLDEIECMTTRELQTALRKEREKRKQDKETSDRLLTSKNKKIDELDKRVHDLQSRSRPWPQRCTDINIEVTTVAAKALEAFDRLDVLRDSILTEEFDGDERDSALEMMAVVYYDAIDQMVSRVVELSQACNEVFFGYKNKAQSLLAMEAPGLSVVAPDEQ